MANRRVGIAGFGVVGQRRKRCIDERTDVDVVAVCDQVLDQVGPLEDGTRCHSSLEGLLQEELDVLIVCLPNNVAPAATIAGLESGLHVFCEKPPGQTPADVKRVMEVEDRNPTLKLMYGFNHRYHDSAQEALSIVRSGRLGAVINMRATYGKAKLITFNQANWRTVREVAGGGVLLDQGIHMVDLIRLFGGECYDVHSFVSNSHWGYDVEDNVYALMRSESGVVSLLNSSATQWRHRFNLDINLEGGSLILGGLITGTKSYGAETLTVVEADPDNDHGDPREQTTLYNQDPSWDREIDAFLDCITNDHEVDEGNSLDALRTMQLVYRIYYADVAWRTRYGIENPDGGREDR